MLWVESYHQSKMAGFSLTLLMLIFGMLKEKFALPLCKGGIEDILKASRTVSENINHAAIGSIELSMPWSGIYQIGSANSSFIKTALLKKERHTWFRRFIRDML